jgi:hypothetical protein
MVWSSKSRSKSELTKGAERKSLLISRCSLLTLCSTSSTRPSRTPWRLRSFHRLRINAFPFLQGRGGTCKMSRQVMEVLCFDNGALGCEDHVSVQATPRRSRGPGTGLIPQQSLRSFLCVPCFDSRSYVRSDFTFRPPPDAEQELKRNHALTHCFLQREVEYLGRNPVSDKSEDEICYE